VNRQNEFRRVLQLVEVEWVRASGKHPGHTPDSSSTTDLNRLATLTEELGEVARCLTYDRDHAGDLRKELIQVAAMAASWAAGIDIAAPPGLQSSPTQNT
jgi:hypothetical protein